MRLEVKVEEYGILFLLISGYACLSECRYLETLLWYAVGQASLMVLYRYRRSYGVRLNLVQWVVKDFIPATTTDFLGLILTLPRFKYLLLKEVSLSFLTKRNLVASKGMCSMYNTVPAQPISMVQVQLDRDIGIHSRVNEPTRTLC